MTITTTAQLPKGLTYISHHARFDSRIGRNVQVTIERVSAKRYYVLYSNHRNDDDRVSGGAYFAHADLEKDYRVSTAIDRFAREEA